MCRPSGCIRQIVLMPKSALIMQIYPVNHVVVSYAIIVLCHLMKVRLKGLVIIYRSLLHTSVVGSIECDLAQRQTNTLLTPTNVYFERRFSKSTCDSW